MFIPHRAAAGITNDNLKIKWGVRQQRSVRRHSKLCCCSDGGEEGWSGVSFCNGSSHLGSHCEQGLPFWWRLTWYLLQDHGNSLICGPRVFPLQQWNHCVRTVGQLSGVKPTPTPTQGIWQKIPVIGLFWWHYIAWRCCHKTMVMKSRSRNDAESDWQWWIWWSTTQTPISYDQLWCVAVCRNVWVFFFIVQQLRSGWQMNVGSGPLEHRQQSSTV